jgi:predicted phosphodiesterase
MDGRVKPGHDDAERKLSPPATWPEYHLEMTMRFAAIADVHGNYLALEAVIADIRAQGIGTIVNLGDMASGPLDARRTMDALMALDAVHVLGNHDRYLIDRPPEKMGSWDRPAHAQLETRHLDWLRAVLPTLVFHEKVFLCHATPASDEVYWLELVTSDGTVSMGPVEPIEMVAKGITQQLILCGHSHIARAVRLRDGRMIVNPGSVGLPGYRDVHPFPHVIEAGTPDARYAILELVDGSWRVTFRHVPYDHDAMAALALRNGQPELASALATGWIR